MLCFIVLRVYCSETIDFIRNGLKLGFKQSVNVETGETWDYGARAETKGLRFIFNRTEKKIDCIEISGSLHKYANNGLHNYNDFSFSDILRSIYNLTKDFGLNPHTTTVHGLEFGVNIQLPYPARQILNEIVLYKKKLGDIRNYGGKGLYRLFDFNQYALKLYDKALQYNLTNANILRVEKKYKVMAALPKGCNIKTLADLLKIDNYKPLESDLINCINNIVFCDSSIQWELLTKPQREMLIQSRMPNYWCNLIDGNSNTYQSTIKRYNSLIEHYGKQNHKHQLGILIGEKLCSFYKSHKEQLENTKQFLTFTQNKPYKELINLPEFNCTTISLLGNNGISHVNRKYCLSCGKDISHQKAESRFCSEKLIGKAGKKCRDNYRYRYAKKSQLFAIV